jgi:hypothetical protein
MPDELITNLSWVDTNHYVVNNAGFINATVRFRPTAVYDIDPTLGTTAVPGFTELAGLYGRYRTIASRIRVEFVNLEDFPVRVFVWPTNFDLGANYAYIAAAMTMPFAKHQMISAKGGVDRVTLTSKNLLSGEIVGSDEVYTDDSYSATISTVPTNNWYWNVGAWSANNNFANGVQVLTFIELTVQFIERLQVNT